MKAIEKAKSHFVKQLKEPTHFFVDEWELDVFAFPITLNFYDKVQAVEGSDLEKAVKILMLIAKDEAGNALFDEDDKDDLLNAVDPQVLLRLSNQLANCLMPDEGEIKN